MLGTFETLLLDDHHVLALSDKVIIHIRRGAVTHALLDRFETETRLLRARNRTQPIGVLMLQEPRSEVNAEDVRARQRTVIKWLGEESMIHVAVVIEGEDASSTMGRSVARGMLTGMPGFRVTGALAEATAWIGAHVGTDPDVLLMTVRRVRSMRATP
jgi:hypothetical protein